jgi:hypothetical protein
MKLKELCELANIPYNSKNPSRSKALLEQRYELRQLSKQQYEIVRELTPQEIRSINTYVRIKPIIKECICTALANIDGNTIKGSIKDYYTILSIVNNNYKYFTYLDFNDIKKNYMINNNIPLENNVLYYEFCKEIDTMFRRIIKECFNELENELLIRVNKQLVFVYRDENGYYYSKEITDEETIKNFLSFGKKYMSKIGYNEWSKVPYLIKPSLRDKISKDLGIAYFYDRYDLVINKDFLPQQTLESVKKQLNNLSIEKVAKSKQGVLKEWDCETVEDCINIIIKTP